jgi:hypothetical protein
VLAQTLRQPQCHAPAGFAVRAIVQAARALVVCCALGQSSANGVLTGGVGRQYLVDKQAQRDHGRINPLAVRADFIVKNLLYLLAAQCLAKGVLPKQGKLLA